MFFLSFKLFHLDFEPHKLNICEVDKPVKRVAPSIHQYMAINALYQPTKDMANNVGHNHESTKGIMWTKVTRVESLVG